MLYLSPVVRMNLHMISVKNSGDVPPGVLVISHSVVAGCLLVKERDRGGRAQAELGAGPCEPEVGPCVLPVDGVGLADVRQGHGDAPDLVPGLSKLVPVPGLGDDGAPVPPPRHIDQERRGRSHLPEARSRPPEPPVG